MSDVRKPHCRYCRHMTERPSGLWCRRHKRDVTATQEKACDLFSPTSQWFRWGETKPL